jgi:hypothetical protein
MKKILFALFVILLTLPGIQQYFKIVEMKPLGGAFVAAGNPAFSIDEVFTGEFQKKYDSFINDNHGFKEFVVRSYNQFFYSVFKIAKTPSCSVGENGHLFLDYYVESTLGMDYIGNQKLMRYAKKIKYVQDYLNHKGVKLITILNPGKGSIESENIPPEYKSKKATLSNYQDYVQQFNALNVNYIDLNAYFEVLKPKAKYPLYPKNGGHWTDYGMCLGMDSIIKHIEKTTAKDLPDFKINEVKMLDSLIDPNNDVLNTMNLFFDVKQGKMPWTEYSIDANGKYKPRTVIVSDSYYWQVMMRGIHDKLFTNGAFWYYFRTKQPGDVPMESIDAVTETLNQEVILLMATDATLNNFPYNYIDILYDKFRINELEVLTKNYIESIQSQESWNQQIIDKAKAGNLTYENQLRLDGEYLAKIKLAELTGREKEIADQIAVIKADKKWYDQILQKAAKEKLDSDFMLYLDAVCVLDLKK